MLKLVVVKYVLLIEMFFIYIFVEILNFILYLVLFFMLSLVEYECRIFLINMYFLYFCLNRIMGEFI